MNLYAKIGLIFALMGFATWAYNEIYDAGATKEKLACTEDKEKLAELHAEELSKLVIREREATEAADNIAKAHYATIITEVEKNAALQKKLADDESIQMADQNGEFNPIIYLTDSSIRVLNQCSQDTALPEAKEKQGFITQNKVTGADLAGYTCKAISQYNRCAIEVNNAIEEFNVE